MSAEFKIVFVDEGGGPSGTTTQAPPTPATLPPLERTPGPADRTTGPRERTREPMTATEGGIRAAEMIGRALGMGGLVHSVKELATAFSALFKAVTQSTAAHTNNAEAVSGRRSPDVVGPKAPRTATGPQVQDAEWEFKGPKPGMVPVGRPFSSDDPPAVANITGPVRSGQELIKAPQPISTIHAKTRVDTVGVKSAVPAVARGAAVAGPSAGSGLAGLAAAAGPAAIAVGALTVAVAAGVQVTRKLFEHFANETERLSGLSARLSGALARSDIRAEFADIRRANRVGPGLARVTDTTSRAQEAATELWTAILEQLLRIEQRFEPMIDIATAMMQLASKAAPPLIKGAEAALQVTSPIIQTADSLAALSKLIRDYLKLGADDKEPDVNDPFMDAFLGLFAGKMDDRDRAKALQAAGARGRAGGGLGAN